MTLHILALETSSSVCGVALLSQQAGHVNVRTLGHDATGEHAERLLPMVDELLMQADIGRFDIAAVAFGQGPGGFTGLRVACGVAQGMAFALNIPVIPVVSLLAVAVRAYDPASAIVPITVVVQDARMGEVYLAAYLPESDSSSGWRELQAPILLNAEHVGHWLHQAVPGWRTAYGDTLSVRLAGDALQAYPQLGQLPANLSWVSLGAPLRPDAETIARLALIGWHTVGGIDPALAAPLYVRDKVAYTTHERQQGYGGNPKAVERVVSLQDMTVEHLDDVAHIEQSVQSFPWTRGNFSDGLQAGYGAWVAVLGGRVVGFCMVMFAPDVAHVLVIAVVPEMQKQGVGSLLLERCEREARSRGLTTIVLEVRPSNQNALNFYRHQGFTQLAIRKDYYPAGHFKREDACVMEKSLSAT
ncbi:tRNA (adenosine(37)-N6)-threonylcarbamoyltransferase complex dimerization subunit type 1 TsaB [Candidimonas sp. SYP-B2681]|uniref:tRNA (adenosine(37)-N6)-threonylcarbamoyltransferase complex dimerization subunit type 1 TsaB n=1 Tax=Candidimonas sp. SYP-B2681 TaxID=2497686 RepID=UPI000F891B58|nr:tRNA (adenosine(37)-N6)-threonylcarbamoyltransferase complex dimerization subunit type 1 TsaB [Candidimonas sp. SYP-B2681]RTZ42452.1 tRNA (adenosine(37)-N6)-threonylcarbamoyltransferase complex dimerization subunit type 1 TsaB [Candidimonas sp. SYP-B2681]